MCHFVDVHIRLMGKVMGSSQAKRPKQGDPMSPTLFLCYMEYLSRLLKKSTKEFDFQFHAKYSVNNITHLAFADDLLLFDRGDIASMMVLVGILEEFILVSGLKINNHKSHIFMAGVRPYERHDILDLIGFPISGLPTRYLGIPLAPRD